MLIIIIARQSKLVSLCTEGKCHNVQFSASEEHNVTTSQGSTWAQRSTSCQPGFALHAADGDHNDGGGCGDNDDGDDGNDNDYALHPALHLADDDVQNNDGGGCGDDDDDGGGGDDDGDDDDGGGDRHNDDQQQQSPHLPIHPALSWQRCQSQRSELWRPRRAHFVSIKVMVMLLMNMLLMMMAVALIIKTTLFKIVLNSQTRCHFSNWIEIEPKQGLCIQTFLCLTMENVTHDQQIPTNAHLFRAALI